MGFAAHEGCEGLIPLLKKPQKLKLIINVPSSNSHIPQSQLPLFCVQGTTTFGSLHVMPPSLDIVVTV